MTHPDQQRWIDAGLLDPTSQPVVNLASRIADIAIAGEVLVNDTIASTVSSHEFEPAGRRSLKGFSEPVRVWTLLR